MRVCVLSWWVGGAGWWGAAWGSRRALFLGADAACWWRHPPMLLSLPLPRLGCRGFGLSTGGGGGGGGKKGRGGGQQGAAPRGQGPRGGGQKKKGRRR